MKKNVTDFAEYLESYFTDYLAAEQGVSKHTIRSYRDTFVLLIDYMCDNQNFSVNKLSMRDFSRDRASQRGINGMHAYVRFLSIWNERILPS